MRVVIHIMSLMFYSAYIIQNPYLQWTKLEWILPWWTTQILMNLRVQAQIMTSLIQAAR